MMRSEKKLRLFLKLTSLIGLIMIFYILYYQEVSDQYYQRLTNTAEFERKVKEIDMPIFSICPNVDEKHLSNLNMTTVVFIDPIMGNNLENIDIIDLYDKVTFQLNKDFLVHLDGNLLKLGHNNVSIDAKIYDIEVIEIKSHQDRCYSIISHNLKRTSTDPYLKLIVGTNISYSEGMEEATFHLTDQNSYMSPIWPAFPSK